jgi:GTPase SAR1 family protein
MFSGTAKTEIVHHLKGRGVETKSEPTTGVDFSRMSFKVDDFSGEEWFHSLSSTYFRLAGGTVLVFDFTNRKLFDECLGG